MLDFDSTMKDIEIRYNLLIQNTAKLDIQEVVFYYKNIKRVEHSYYRN